MSKYKRGFGVLLCLMLIGSAWAAGTTANVSWDPVVFYTDGSALPATDIAFYTVSWPGGAAKVGGTVSATTIPVPCGNTAFAVSVTTSATAKYPNATSTQSSSVPYATGVTCTPKTVTGVTVS